MNQQHTGSHSILIVDDDQNHVTLMGRRLEAAGYDILVAVDGLDGLNQAIHRRPDLIITDVLLPKMSGFQLVEQIKVNPETGTIPVIMMSAVYVTDEDMMRGVELGAESYMAKADLAMRKPMQAEALLEAVSGLLGKVESREEAPASARILVADDDPNTVRLVTKRLLPEGFQVDSASDGQQVLDKVFDSAYDLVLLDYKMPEVDGLTVLSRIKERTPGVAVVIMTAYGSETVAMESLRRGADDYLIKPLDENEPLPTVRVNLEKARRKRELEDAAAQLRLSSSPEYEDKERLIEELRQSSISLMEQYDRLLAAEEQNRAYAERLEQMVEERTGDLKRRTQELSVLHSVLSAATRSLELPEVLDITLKEIGELLQASSAAAFVLDQVTGRLRLVTQKSLPEDFLRWVSKASASSEELRQVVETGAPLMVDDFEEREGFSRLSGQAVCSILVPMRTSSEVVGLMMAACTEHREIDDNGWKLLKAIGEEVGVVVENVRLYENLRLAYLSTIRALAEAVDAKDSYTRGHSERVSTLAEATARELGLAPDEVESVRDAGYLHDIGKIGTPDSVLTKNGVLTSEEMETMKLHPGDSHRILSHAQLSESIKEMIRHHHERYDGGGYPDGLRGDEIPLGSKILAVADAYEAMTSNRPYRDCMDVEDAVRELRGHAGDQFDPEVVEAFLRVRDKVEGGGAGS
ncbi:MAG: response regulator [Gaiellales bacterium]|nr:MAG: response regulator [Gaiellales bacterium]